jgi:hypothetical protein
MGGFCAPLRDYCAVVTVAVRKVYYSGGCSDVNVMHASGRKDHSCSGQFGLTR